MAPRRDLAVAPIVLAVAVTAAVFGFAVWHMHLHGLDEQIDQRQAAIKRLTVSQGIPPTEDVRTYLKQRDESLRRSYRQWLDRVVVGGIAEAATADPQLFFQERVHEVQRDLERLAAGRNVPVPEMIGLPKELPPTETVSRLLAQLGLTQAVATLILEQGAIPITTFKLEDPESVNSVEGRAVLLTRVPLRVRMRSTLPQLMRLMEACARARPLIDVRALRIASGAQADRLEVEVLLARYLPTTQLDALLDAETTEIKEESSKEPSGFSKPRRNGKQTNGNDGA